MNKFNWRFYLVRFELEPRLVGHALDATTDEAIAKLKEIAEDASWSTRRLELVRRTRGADPQAMTFNLEEMIDAQA